MYSDLLKNFFRDYKNKRYTHIPKLQKYDEIYKNILSETSFLDELNPTLPQRIWYIKNDIFNIVLCKECNSNPVSWDSGKAVHRTYCSIKCKSKSQDVKDKSKQTWKEIYGVDNPQKSELVNNKSKKTKLERYGTETFSNPEKRKQTCLEKYGAKTFAESLRSPESLEKVKNKDFLYEQHVTLRKPIDKIAKELDLHPSTVSSYLKSAGLSIIRYKTSEGEKELSDFLREHFNILTNIRDIISPKELDIFIPEKNVAVEYCGLYWHSFEINNNVNVHKEKYESCRDKGIKLITIFEDEWFTKKEIVKNKLLHILGVNKNQKVFARKCKVKEIDSITAKKFHNENHIQGYASGFLHIGLFFDDKIVSCISFKKRNAQELELIRYSTNCSVVGGFSKLLSFVLSNNKVFDIVTFADLRWHYGEVYLKCGFYIDKIIAPDYQYIIDHFSGRSHKFNFRKAIMKKKFGDLYDESLTEFSNAKNMKLYRIYDCGKVKYRYKRN